ncbi:hypothetical protein AN189_02540 [Loktanella sp. 3ANDIMAR09]|nr:hypothetical protein AN189_02540 [Loktanella sp. 3ANDIMAR09]
MPQGRADSEESFRFLRGLPFRVVAFLSLALLPIGMLAIWQTKDLDETLRERTELSLIARTELGSSGERRAIQSGIGSASAIAEMYPELVGDPERCSAAVSRLVENSPIYSFIGFVPVGAPILCSSLRTPISEELIDEEIRSRSSSAVQSIVPLGDITGNGRSFAVLLQPILNNDTVVGQVAIAIPTDVLTQQQDMTIDDQPLSMVIYNQTGDVISTQGEPLDPAVVRSLVEPQKNGSIFDPQRRVVRNQRPDGHHQVLTTAALIPGVAYAVGSWDPADAGLQPPGTVLPTFSLPVLMWFASLLVAYFAVHRLVVAPIRDLQKRMRLFAVNRSLPNTNQMERLPTELFELEKTFGNMAYDLMDDEARMEDSLREKNVLLKEIHHRVKNNLQMISSIINMEIRASEDNFARNKLKRLHARIIGLATVHRLLYKSDNLGRAEAEPLMQEVSSTLFDALSATHPKADTRLTCDTFSLIPDQAVPMSLFIGETGAQAVRDMPVPTAENPGFLHISLKIVSPGTALIICRSPYAVKPDHRTTTEVKTGAQLMRAFAMQLGSDFETTESDGIRTRTLSFAITSNIPDALDY